MAQFTFNAKFIFSGTVTINADTEEQARQLAAQLHMTTSGGIHTQLPPEVLDWDFGSHADIAIQSAPQYVLIGKDAVYINNNIGFDELLEYKENIVFEVRELQGDTSPAEIMQNLDGWSDWCYITKEQFDQLSEI